MAPLFQTHPLSTLVSHELRALSREGTFTALLGIFFLTTLFSVFIGWSTRATTNAVYYATVNVLHAAGAASVGANPLRNVSALTAFDNLAVYTLLVGALLAVVAGHRSFIRDRASGVVPLMLSRPVSRHVYIAGKLCGVFLSLLFIIIGMFVVSAMSTWFIPALHLSGGEFLLLAGFYAASFFYLSFFAALGLLFAVVTPNESLALLLPVIVWVAIVFIFPELSTGQNPVSLLNPVTLAQMPPAAEGVFSTMRSILSPFSFGQDYTALALYFLRSAGHSVFYREKVLELLAATVITSGACARALERYSLSSDELT